MSSSSSFYSSSIGHICSCETSVMRTSWTIHNFGRRFWGCNQYKVLTDFHSEFIFYIILALSWNFAIIIFSVWYDLWLLWVDAWIQKLVCVAVNLLEGSSNSWIGYRMSCGLRIRWERMAREKEIKWKVALVMSWVFFLVLFFFVGSLGKVGTKTLNLPRWL